MECTLILDLLMYVQFDTGLLADPVGSRPIVAAVEWLEQTVLGTIATTIAVVAVAGVGMRMLTGRLEIRRGIVVIVGCFFLFGASSIVAGLQSAVAGDTDAEAVASARVEETSPLPAVLPIPGPSVPQQPGHYDPYAGAAVPMR